MERTVLAIDIETKDATLKESGPGVFKNTGDYILGVSFADDAGYSEYINLGHDNISEEDRRKNLARVTNLLSTPVPKLGHNVLYDLVWLQNWANIPVRGKIIDTQTAAALLDECRESYSLDSVAGGLLGLHKEKDEISEFCEINGYKGDPRAHLWRMPWSLVNKYALMDTKLLIPLWAKMKPMLEEQELSDLMDIECRLIPMLVDMHKVGVKVDTVARDEIRAAHEEDLKLREAAWYAKYPGVNYNSTKQLADIFEREGIPYEVSNGGKQELLSRLGRRVDPKRLPMINAEDLFAELGFSNIEARKYRLEHPSITKEVLENAAEDFPVAREVEELKQVDKVISTFFKGTLDRFVMPDGRIHATFYPTSSDSGGTRTGRFSSANPNMQQLPKKKKGATFDPMVRNCCVPEENCWWVKADLSSAEYRMFAHYARGEGAQEFQQKYIDDPTTDFHKLVSSMAGLERDDGKRLNFAVLYFLSQKSMQRKFHWSEEKCQVLTDRYFKMFPFITPTRDSVLTVGKQRGYIKTLLKRRIRMSPAMLRDKKHFVLFNGLLQGSVGDYVKKAMVDIYEAGITKVIPLSLTVHDEIDGSVPKTREGIEAAEEMQYLMEHAIKLRVPMLSEVEFGDNWGQVEGRSYEELRKEIS